MQKFWSYLKTFKIFFTIKQCFIAKIIALSILAKIYINDFTYFVKFRFKNFTKNIYSITFIKIPRSPNFPIRKCI